MILLWFVVILLCMWIFCFTLVMPALIFINFLPKSASYLWENRLSVRPSRFLLLYLLLNVAKHTLQVHMSHDVEGTGQRFV